MNETVVSGALTVYHGYPYTDAGVWFLQHDCEQWMYASIALAALMVSLNQLYITLGNLVLFGQEVWKRLPSFWNLFFLVFVMGMAFCLMWAYLKGEYHYNYMAKVLGPFFFSDLPPSPPSPSSSTPVPTSTDATYVWSLFKTLFVSSSSSSSSSSYRDL